MVRNSWGALDIWNLFGYRQVGMFMEILMGDFMGTKDRNVEPLEIIY